MRPTRNRKLVIVGVIICLIILSQVYYIARMLFRQPKGKYMDNADKTPVVDQGGMTKPEAEDSEGVVDDKINDAKKGDSFDSDDIDTQDESIDIDSIPISRDRVIKDVKLIESIYDSETADYAFPLLDLDSKLKDEYPFQTEESTVTRKREVSVDRVALDIDSLTSTTVSYLFDVLIEDQIGDLPTKYTSKDGVITYKDGIIVDYFTFRD